ncbi:ubiquitin carboxyl-terminal hydrolase 47-like [Protopterus annectens]|uniref:ubiquitin carboxyl-terminal hydrolase 47-like n=1 Tax=Protopterus annectens TaxID=7888 RepID=UPI001CFA7184|nr:ubiquitin carboxyl-terminal hydrolase 47-like [Protopterus annectens]
MVEFQQGFNGLVNHGATCYMNTLLQALFWTPDFRSMIYNWYSTSDASGNDENDITYQLNNLFRDLEEGEEPANPNKVIKCLGINNTCKQEDVATYFSLLMKKISNIQGLGQKLLQLFESEQVCVVKCNECQQEDKKTTKLLQIPVPIQLTGSKHFNSVAETFQTFKAEALCDENQVYCDICEKKCDAKIQYYRESPPEVLVLQLKRFCFDSRSDSYVKDDAPILITKKLEFECVRTSICSLAKDLECNQSRIVNNLLKLKNPQDSGDSHTSHSNAFRNVSLVS